VFHFWHFSHFTLLFRSDWQCSVSIRTLLSRLVRTVSSSSCFFSSSSCAFASEPWWSEICSV
jgi:hypothetical protein